MPRLLPLAFSISCLFSATVAAYAPADLLPPVLPWQGASEALIHDDPKWQTPAEAMALADTPDYQQTLAFIKRLTAHSPKIRLIYIGDSAQGRPIPLVIASAEGFDKPDALLRAGKPSLLAQAGIHAGEIDGKDAGLMLLRDIALGEKSDLLDKANLLFVPIFNVDGHERRSVYNRVNQRGPVSMGWRTTAQNLNLNRDYAKGDTPEMAAMLALFNEWRPDLYLDLHVTDGVDYQYDVTYGFTGEHGYSPEISRWLTNHFAPAADRALGDQGHIPGPLVFAMDKHRMEKGIAGWTAGPRYSDGYGDARHMATVLVENHRLNPYRQRVLGTYVLLESSLRTLADHGKALKQATTHDKASRPAEMPLAWHYDSPQGMSFKGMAYETYQDSASGSPQVKWLGEAKHYDDLPVHPKDKPADIVAVPRAYWLMPEQFEVIERLARHGIPAGDPQTANHPHTRAIDGSQSRVRQEPLRGPDAGQRRLHCRHWRYCAARGRRQSEYRPTSGYARRGAT